MAEIKVNINGIDDALDRLKKLETLCKSASMKKIPHGDVSGQVINQLTDIIIEMVGVIIPNGLIDWGLETV